LRDPPVSVSGLTAQSSATKLRPHHKGVFPDDPAIGFYFPIEFTT